MQLASRKAQKPSFRKHDMHPARIQEDIFWSITIASAIATSRQQHRNAAPIMSTSSTRNPSHHSDHTFHPPTPRRCAPPQSDPCQTRPQERGTIGRAAAHQYKSPTVTIHQSIRLTLLGSLTKMYLPSGCLNTRSAMVRTIPHPLVNETFICRAKSSGL